MAFINSVSHYVPKKVVNNIDLVQFPEKYRGVIAEKAGVLSRRHVDSECTSDLGSEAVKRLLSKNSIDPNSIDVLICATSSPDRIQPATATRIQELCGLKNAYAFDVNSVCSSAVFAMKIAKGLISDGADNVLVVASEVYSKILNPNELTTFPYFGDGAGAVLISRSSGQYEIRDFFLGSDGGGADIIQVPAGGTMYPATEVQDQKDFYFKMVGREVFNFACEKGTEIIKRLSEANGVVPDLVIPHQANVNIVREIGRRSNLSFDKFFLNIEKYANTAGASVVIALDEYLQTDPSAKDIFLIVFGGGLSWGGCYLTKKIQGS